MQDSLEKIKIMPINGICIYNGLEKVNYTIKCVE